MRMRTKNCPFFIRVPVAGSSFLGWLGVGETGNGTSRKPLRHPAKDRGGACVAVCSIPLAVKGRLAAWGVHDPAGMKAGPLIMLVLTAHGGSVLGCGARPPRSPMELAGELRSADSDDREDAAKDLRKYP